MEVKIGRNRFWRDPCGNVVVIKQLDSDPANECEVACFHKDDLASLLSFISDVRRLNTNVDKGSLY